MNNIGYPSPSHLPDSIVDAYGKSIVEEVCNKFEDKLDELDDYKLADLMKMIERRCLKIGLLREHIKRILTMVNIRCGGRFKEFLGYDILPTTIEEDMINFLTK